MIPTQAEAVLGEIPPPQPFGLVFLSQVFGHNCPSLWGSLGSLPMMQIFVPLKLLSLSDQTQLPYKLANSRP